MDRNGPGAPGEAHNHLHHHPPPGGGRGDINQNGSVTPADVREKVRAFVSRHGLATIVGMRADRAPAGPVCDEAAIVAIADLAMTGDGAALRQTLETYTDAGWSNSVLLLDLLGPAVRLIGTYWEEDRADFATVSVATALVQRTVYELTEANRRPPRPDARRALIAVTPGDQHSFGAVVVSELLRAAGWFFLTRLDASENELCADVASDRFALIGFSLSRTSRIPDLARTIECIRAGGQADGAVFAVGGRVFADGEAGAFDVGADLVAIDVHELIRLMDEQSTFVAAD